MTVPGLVASTVTPTEIPPLSETVTPPAPPPIINNDPVVIQAAEKITRPAEAIPSFSFGNLMSTIHAALHRKDEDQIPAKNDVVFYGMGTTVDLGKGPVNSPLVYATAKTFRFVYDSSLIELPLSTLSGMQSLIPLPYWPTYHDSNPRQRGQYLNWIYSGRKDPTIELGYVFIFFYGLERRILIDGADHVVVIEELLRLMSIYSQSNSFRNYASALLWTAIYLGRDQEGVNDDVVNRAIKATPALKDDILTNCLGYFVRTSKPLPIELVFMLADQDSRSINSVVTKRHHEHFRNLFHHRILDSFLTGFKLPDKVHERKLRYYPASGSLSAERDTLKQINNCTVPEFNLSSKQFGVLAQIWNKCIEELKEFDRASRRSDFASMSTEMYESLPSEVRTGDHPELAEWQDAISEGADNDGWSLVAISRLTSIKKFPSRERLPKKEVTTILSTADALGFAIEPDARITGKDYRSDEIVAIYKSDNNELDRKGLLNYQFASLLLKLSLTIARADGKLDVSELARITDHLEQEFNLDVKLSKRLRALKHTLLNSESIDGAVTKSLRDKLPIKERKVIGRFLVEVATVDNVICQSERKALKKAFQSLGIPTEDLAAALAEHDAIKVTNETLKTEVVLSEEISLAPVLDLDRIRAIHEETRQVQEMLHNVFSDEVSSFDERTQQPSNSAEESLDRVVLEHQPIAASDSQQLTIGNHDFESSRFQNLPERYRRYLEAIITSKRWEAVKFTNLARQHGLMSNAATEAINEWSMDEYEDLLIEESGTEIIIHSHLLESN